MKKKYLMIFALFALILPVKAQYQKIRKSIYDVVIPTDRLYLKEEHKNEFVTFSFAISVNSKGMVDSIRFSDTVNDEFKKSVDFKKIDQQFKADRKTFISYKNSLFFGMVLIVNGDEAYLNPAKGLYPAWPNLLNNLSPMLKNRKLIVLDPVLKLLYFKKSD
jgi:hypothetical protein